MGFINNLLCELKKNTLRPCLSIFIYRIGFLQTYILKSKILKALLGILYYMLRFLHILIGEGNIPPRKTYIDWGMELPHGFIGTIINEHCIIGKNLKMFHNVTIGNLGDIRYNVKIGDDVYIGCNVTILGNMQIGNNCAIGACTSIINKDIPSNTKVYNGIKYICKNINSEYK